MSEIKLRAISLGAGVQITTMALLAARGDTPDRPDCAIFADTQSEPTLVYRHLDWLEQQLPFPVFRVTAGSLRDQILAAMNGKARMDARPPFFTLRGGMLRRQCTHDFKILPIQRKVRELLGLQKGQRGPRTVVVEQWIGISLDEAVRMRPSRLPYVAHRYPLVDARMTRADCIEWCRARAYPRPPKSACTFCPYRSNAEWRALRDHDPDAFADAVLIDEAIRPGIPGPKRPKDTAWFVHADRQPLATVDLTTPEDRGQLNLFLNECDGLCVN
ncbi:MAG: hypothetical protein IT537_08485 [Hyphomicrobiales bacterium]|nr:hypothetical protein [Hyphomicrobiales bacterium]